MFAACPLWYDEGELHAERGVPVNPNETIRARLRRCALLPPEEAARALPSPAASAPREPARLKKDRPATVLHCIRRSFLNPFSVILFVLGLISFVTDVLLPAGYQKSPTTVLIIFVMLLVSGLVRLAEELRAKRVADALFRLTDTTVTVRRGEDWEECPADCLRVGDVVRLRAGDRVPADLRLTEAADLFVSQSVLTGESAVLEKTAEALTEVPDILADYRNILFCGTTVTGGTGTGIVLAVDGDTVYGGTPAAVQRRRGFARGAGSIARVLIRFMVILVPVVFVASGLTKGDWLEAFLFAVSVAVGLTPELLPMVVNACLAKGSYTMGRKQTVVKDIDAMQALGCMDVLCVDKTGTLTGDTIRLEYYMDVLGNESRRVLDLAYLASVYHTGVPNHLDNAIRRAREMPGQAAYYDELAAAHPKVDELPFDSAARSSCVLLRDEEQDLLILKGSLDAVVPRCSRVEYRGQVLDMGADAAASVHAVVDEMLEDGMKVLAVACKHCPAGTVLQPREDGFTLLGYLAFFDAPKQSAASAVAKLQELRVGVKVLSGDQKQVVLSICRRLGLDTAACLTGAELEALTDNERPVVIEKTAVFAELSPRQKAFVVENLQDNGHTVGFLGDGMNDMPGLLRADVGISVENAAEAVRDAASVLLLKKDLNVLEEGILEGRRAFANMTKYIRITASSNFGNICAIVAASVLLPFFPMTSVQLLLLNLLYDLLCLVLPWDNVDPELLRRPPEWSGRTLGRFMTFFGPLSSVFDLLTFAFLYFILCPRICGGAFGTLNATGQERFIALFQTGWFLESMWTQVLILHLLRTRQLPFLRSRPSRAVLGVTLLGIVLYTLLPLTPPGRLLGLVPMPPVYLGFLVAVVAGYLLVVSLAKTVYIRKYRDLS